MDLWKNWLSSLCEDSGMKKKKIEILHIAQSMNDPNFRMFGWAIMNSFQFHDQTLKYYSSSEFIAIPLRQTKELRLKYEILRILKWSNEVVHTQYGDCIKWKAIHDISSLIWDEIPQDFGGYICKGNLILWKYRVPLPVREAWLIERVKEFLEGFLAY